MLVLLYFNLSTTPGMPLHVVATCSDALDVLTRSKKKLSIEDFRLPWRPLFDILVHDLFLTRRQFEVRCVHARLWAHGRMNCQCCMCL